MSETKWSPEPWGRGEEHEHKIEILDASGREVGRVHGGLFESRAAMEARFRRIVACVNALAGVPTEALESGALKALLDGMECVAIGAMERDTWARVHAALRSLGRLP